MPPKVPVAHIRDLRFNPPMQALRAVLRAYAERAEARWWVGERPDVPEGHLVQSIAGRVGYPTAREDPFEAGGIIQLDWGQAARVLAIAGTESLVFGTCTPAETALGDAKAALKDFAGNAEFYGNGHWDARLPVIWSPLTSATFDCGVIGYDSQNAFIFWVEEED